jgi:hypothetical protein
LYLQENSLTGSIPAAIGDMTQLLNLYLNDNSLTGALPDSFSNLRSVTFIDVSANFLTGGPRNYSTMNDLDEFYYEPQYTFEPSAEPTSAEPTAQPSDPSSEPTVSPTDPTAEPSAAPTDPTAEPTAAPSDEPTFAPSEFPTMLSTDGDDDDASPSLESAPASAAVIVFATVGAFLSAAVLGGLVYLCSKYSDASARDAESPSAGLAVNPGEASTRI